MVLETERGEVVDIVFGNSLCGEVFTKITLTSEEITKNFHTSNRLREKSFEYLEHLILCRMKYHSNIVEKSKQQGGEVYGNNKDDETNRSS